MTTQFTRLAAAALLLVAAAATPAYSQDAKAAEVIAKARKALGDKKLESLKTLTAQAAMDRNIGSMQTSSEVELFVEMPDKYLRSEVSRGMMNMTMNTGFNGGKAIMPAGGNMSAGPGGAMVIRMGPGGARHGDGEKPTPEQLAQMNEGALRTARTDVSRMMLGWFGAAHPSLNAQYTYAGEAESPDGKAHVIDVKGNDGFEARLFIDQNNHLPLMVTYKARPPRIMMSGALADLEKAIAEQPLSDLTLFFDDWREVDGLTFPHTMRRAVAGETTEEWTFSKVKVNSKIDPAKFAVEAK
ncbi:MAG: hypothetical protein WEB50_09880 [Vicinamibacterales bacterium]